MVNSASTTITAAVTIAGPRAVRPEGQSACGAATTGIVDLSRSRHTSTAQASTARPARIIPTHIVRCGLHVIVTVVGEFDGGRRHPLKPPETGCGAPRSFDPAFACHPLFRP